MQGFRLFLESVDLAAEHDVLGMYSDSRRFNIRQISELTGVSVAGIYRILEKYRMRPTRRDHSNQHEIVRQYHNSGVSAKKISELTGYSSRQVYNIIAKGSGLNGLTD